MIKKYPPIKRLQSKSGFVFITVLMIIIVMIVLTITMMSLNVSQVANSEAEYRRIQATELAKGVIAFHVAKQHSAAPYSGPYQITPATLDGKDFTVTVTTTTDNGTNPNQTNALIIRTDY